jgi:hypothetical protein
MWRRAACAAMLTLIIAAMPAARKNGDVTVASGKLVHHALTDDLFHIDRLWMRVPSDTEFHRWLSQGINRKVEIVLTYNPRPFDDVAGVRVLTGTMTHNTAPSAKPVVHILFLRDEATGSLGPITFQTTDDRLARKFDDFDSGDVSLVMRLR